MEVYGTLSGRKQYSIVASDSPHYCRKNTAKVPETAALLFGFAT